jgi:hypothetical protein
MHPGYLKVNHLYVIKTQGAPELMPYAKFLTLSDQAWY